MLQRTFFCVVACAALSSICDAQPPGGRGRGGPGGGPGRSDDAFAQRLATLDENEDGGLSEKELPEHMQKHFASSDANKDGLLKGDEITKLASHFSRQRLQGGGAAGPGGAGAGGRGSGGAGPGAGGGRPGMRGGPGGGGPWWRREAGRVEAPAERNRLRKTLSRAR